MTTKNNQELLQQIDRLHSKHRNNPQYIQIWNSLCIELNWFFLQENVKPQYKYINQLLRTTKYGRSWPFNSPLLNQPISIPGFYPMFFNYSLYMPKSELQHFTYGIYELAETLLMLRIAPYIKSFIDVGANIGYYSFLMSKFVPVTSFEPCSETYGYLLKGIEYNQLNVNALKYAVSDIAGEQNLYLSDDPGHNSLCPAPEHNRQETIKAVTLEEYRSAQTLIKIDVEDHEISVLKGMTQWLGSKKEAPLIMVESLAPNNKKVISILESYGYKVYSVNNKPKHGDLPLLPASKSSPNWLAIPAWFTQDIFAPIDIRILTPSDKLLNLLKFLQEWDK